MIGDDTSVIHLIDGVWRCTACGTWAARVVEPVPRDRRLQFNRKMSIRLLDPEDPEWDQGYVQHRSSDFDTSEAALVDHAPPSALVVFVHCPCAHLDAMRAVNGPPGWFALRGGDPYHRD